jgi:hypothetical protein
MVQPGQTGCNREKRLEAANYFIRLRFRVSQLFPFLRFNK